MREALHIFRKDVRHLWPRSLPVLVFAALWGWFECASASFAPYSGPLKGLWILGAAFLVLSAIQQEALPGDRQYWLARPYRRSNVFLSKLLFIAVFAALPLLTIETISLAIDHFSIFRHLPLLLGTVTIFILGVYGFVAAVAAVTESLVQSLWGFLPALALVALGFAAGERYDDAGDWGDLEWIRTFALILVLLAAAVAVLILQYSRRKTNTARVVLGCAVVMVASGPLLGSWHAVWASTGGVSKLHLDGPGPQLAFDQGTRTAPSFADATYAPRAGRAGINLPVQLTGMPGGTAVVSERIKARIDAPDGRSWSGNWTRNGGLYRTTPLVDAFLMPGDGAYWEYIAVDDAFYRAVKDSPVHVHTTVALTLLRYRESHPVATRDRNEFHSDEGTCRVMPGPFAKLLLVCAWLAHAPARSYVTAVAPDGQTYETLISTSAVNPFPLNGSVWSSGVSLFTPPPAVHEMDVETWQAVAHFDRELDVPQIRLSDFAVRRITDMP